MALFDEKVTEQLKQLLEGLKNPVELIYFTQEIECGACKDGHDFVKEFSKLSDKINLTSYDFKNDEDEVSQYGIQQIPAIVVTGPGEDSGIRFYGIPGGYEINSFISAIMDVSGAGQELPREITDRIRNIDKDIHLQVLVSLSCPHCPAAVSAAHKMAAENPKIRADMIDTALFPHLAVKYEVQGVPKTVINEKAEVMGAQPIQAFLDAAEKV